MTVLGVDFSWARPGGKAIREAGFTFVVRYIDYPGAGGKGLTADALADLRANGLAVVLVFESTAARAKEGYGSGAMDALETTNALARLGFPNDRPVYFAVDFDAQPGDMKAIDAYLRGCASVLGAERVGVYGSYAVVKFCAYAQSARWCWQTYAWSGGRKFDGNHIYQYRNGQVLNGGEVDYNEALQDDYGQWPAEEGDEVTTTEYEDLLLALFSGKEEADKTREERLTNARYRMAERAGGRTASIGEDVAALLIVASQLREVMDPTVEAIGRAGIDRATLAAGLRELADKMVRP